MVSNPLIDRSLPLLSIALNLIIFVLTSISCLLYNESTNQGITVSLHPSRRLRANGKKRPHHGDRDSCLAAPETHYEYVLRSTICEGLEGLKRTARADR